MLAMDVKRLDPDFVLFPTYKWLIGPYGRAFLYVAKRHQDGIPLEQTAAARRNVRAENEVYFTDLGYVADARRFDMGERDHFISLEMAAIGMEMVAEWGAAAIAQRLAMLTERIADGVRRSRRRRHRAGRAGPAYPEPRVQGRDAERTGRGTCRRRHLRRGAPWPRARLAARLQRRSRC